MAITTKPSRRFRQAVAQFESPRLAARAWGIWPESLQRFLDGESGLNLNTAAQIVEATGLSYDALFEHEETKT